MSKKPPRKKLNFNYDPNIHWGRKKIRITLGQWRFRYSVDIEVGGNTRGVALMNESLIEDELWERMREISGRDDDSQDDDMDEVVTFKMQDGPGTSLICEFTFEELKDAVIGMEIIGIKEEKL